MTISFLKRLEIPMQTQSSRWRANRATVRIGRPFGLRAHDSRWFSPDPMPKNFSHSRFACTREVSGLAGSTIQRASPSRFGGVILSATAGDTAGTPGCTLSPCLSYCAADQNKRIPRLGQILHHHRVGQHLFSQDRVVFLIGSFAERSSSFAAMKSRDPSRRRNLASACF